MSVVPITSSSYEHAQLTFEGLPVVAATFRTKGSKVTPTEHTLAIGQAVEVHIRGRVIGVEHTEMGEGSVTRVHVVEVLEARLDG